MTLTPFQIMPPLMPEEREALEQSITEHGVLTPIVVDDAGVIIDGHHRQEIAAKLGVFCPRRAVRDLTDEQKVAMALTLNVDRRHLTREQRRELLAASLKAEPGASDREHGRRTGSSDKTAGVVRRELEARAEIPHAETRTDAAGRQQPANKSSETPKPPPLPWARWGQARRRNMLEQWGIQWSSESVLGEFGALAGSDCITSDEAKELLRLADRYLTQLNSVRKLLRQRATEVGAE